ncbi:hypothetical protein V1511DRAFT_493143 [Dipodascopsis uninucleata]
MTTLINNSPNLEDTDYSMENTSLYRNMTMIAELFPKKDKESLKIVVENKQEYYEPGDCLSGSVFLKPTKDIKIEDIEIRLDGVVHTYTDRINIGGRLSMSKKILEMISPVSLGHYPDNGIALSGDVYRFRFSFVLPELLLESQCDKILSHRQLPSSLGKGNTTKLDDLAPDMTSVEYSIQAKFKLHDETHLIKSEMLEVLSSYLPDKAAPPAYKFHETESSRHTYTGSNGGFHRFCRTSKTVKKGLLSRTKKGVLDIETSISKPFIYGKTGSSVVPLEVSMTYTPVAGVSISDVAAPEIESVFSNLYVMTYFATEEMPYIPTQNSLSLDSRLGLYTSSIALSRFYTSNTARKNSCGSVTANWVSEENDSSTSLKLNIAIPMLVPQGYALVPNFWSCFIGRQYMLETTIRFSNSSGVSRVLTRMNVEITSDRIYEKVLMMTQNDEVASEASNNEQNDETLDREDSQLPEEILGEEDLEYFNNLTSRRKAVEEGPKQN